MGKGYNPFDLNHDGKADWQDAYIYNELIDSDEDSYFSGIRKADDGSQQKQIRRRLVHI